MTSHYRLRCSWTERA